MRIVTVTSNSTWYYTTNFIMSLPTGTELVIGDAGLLPDQRGKLEAMLKVMDIDYSFYEWPVKDYSDDIETQDQKFRGVMRHWPQFIIDTLPCLSMDIDTMIIKDDWSLIDFDADITLTVRPMGNMKEYPNLGVVWYHTDKCIPFIEKWIMITDLNFDSALVPFEQSNFVGAMSTDEFKELKVQNIHCRFYNCYQMDWLEDARVIHLKGFGHFDIKRLGLEQVKKNMQRKFIQGD